MPRTAAALLALALALAATGAHAQSSDERSAAAQSAGARADTTARGLGRVTVTASRVPTRALDAPAHVTLLTRADAEAAAATSVADLLGARAPLHVRRYGPAGLATVALRGASASQTLVLLDGAPLVDPQLGQTDLALVPTALVAGVEVRHGGGAHLYGSGAVGGVVALTTGAAGPPLALRAEAGAWGHRLLSGAARGAVETPAGRLSATLAAEGAAGADDYRSPDPGFVDGRLVRRAGWDRRRASAAAGLRLDRPAGHVGATLWLADAERGLGGTDAVGARQWDRTARLGLAAEGRRAWGRLHATAAATRARLRYASPYRVADGATVGAAAIDAAGRTTALHADLGADVRAPRGWTLSAVAALGLGTADHPSLADDPTDRRLGLALAATPSRGRVRLSPALRADLVAPAGGADGGAAVQRAVTPQLGLNVRLAPTLHARASAGTAFRTPTLNDRFWRPGGDPALRPERSASADAGLAWAAGASRAEATVYAAAARDQIVWRPTAAGYWAPQNLARTRTLGLEASAETARRVRRTAVATAGLALALTDARDRSDPGSDAFGAQLRLVPRWTAKAWAGAEARRGGATLRLGLALRAVGARPTTDSGSLALPAYAVADATLAAERPLGSVRAALALALDNLTGARYSVVPNHPMPPRNLRVRLALTSL